MTGSAPASGYRHLTALVMAVLVIGSAAIPGTALFGATTAHATTAANQPTSTFVEVDPQDLPGEGTRGDPYEISNASELQAIEDDLDAHYALTSDIDATGTTTWNNASGFRPIGTDHQTTFSGHFDGNDHVITNLTINRSGTNNVGLFGFVNDGTIQNVHLRNATVSGNKEVGTLVGDNTDGTITNASATGTVTGSQKTGGLVGENMPGTVRFTWAGVDVNGGSFNTGGLVGRNYGEISYSYTTGNVSGGNSVGGITGFTYTVITDIYATGTVTGDGRVGALIGYVHETGGIRDAYATGATSGGIIGYFEASGTVDDVYYDTETTGLPDAAHGTGLPTANMTGDAARTNMTGLDFQTVWTTRQDHYPGLQWQPASTEHPPLEISLRPSYGVTHVRDDAVSQTPNVAFNRSITFTNGTTYRFIITDEDHGGTISVRPPVNLTVKENVILLLPHPDGTITGENAFWVSGKTDVLDTTVTTQGTVATSGITNLSVSLVAVNSGTTIASTEPQPYVQSYVRSEAQNSTTGTIRLTVNQSVLPPNTTLTATIYNQSAGRFPEETIDNTTTQLEYNSTQAAFIGHFSAAELHGGTYNLQLRGTLPEPYDSEFQKYSPKAITITVESTPPDSIDVDPSDLPGDGTQEAPYQISNTSELQAIEDDLDAHYVLTSDIDAAGTSQWHNGSGFDPIGENPFQQPAFSGTLDGQNHTISGLVVNRPSRTFAGLFGGLASEGVVRNLILVNTSIHGDEPVGGFVGLNQGHIHQVAYEGTVTSEWNEAGGLVGDNRGLISQSVANATVSDGYDVGGLVGSNSGSGVIRNSTAVGTHTVAGYSNVGGLVGLNYGAIHDSYAAPGQFNGGFTSGGFVGENKGTISDAYWDINTTGESSSSYATGLTTAEMTGDAADSNMTGLDFQTEWTTQSGDYPRLGWLPDSSSSGPSPPDDGETRYAFSFERAEPGASSPAAPWNLTKTAGVQNVSAARATHGNQSLFLAGSSGLGESWATVELNLTGVATVRGDIYVEQHATSAGDIKVHVDNTSGKLFGATQRAAGQWHTGLEGDASQYEGVHTLILRTRGDANQAYFDNLTFYDATGTQIPIAELRPANTTPVSFEYTPTSPTTGETVSFNVTTPTDRPDSAYEWDVENDGTIDATGPNVTHTFEEPGEYTVQLTITEDTDTNSTTTQTITVTSTTQPSPRLTVPFTEGFQGGLHGWAVNARFRTGDRREPGAGDFDQSLFEPGDGGWVSDHNGSVRLHVDGGPSSVGVARNLTNLSTGDRITATFESDTITSQPGKLRLILYPPGDGNMNEIMLNVSDTSPITGTVPRDLPDGTQLRVTADVWPGEYTVHITEITTERGPEAPSDGGDSRIASFSSTQKLTANQTSPESLAGKLRVESSYANNTSVKLLRATATNYSLEITAPDSAENATFYLQTRAISASQNIENLTMYLDGEEHEYVVNDSLEPGESPWVAFNVPHFSTRTVTFTSDSDPPAAPAIVAPSDDIYNPSEDLTIGVGYNATGVISPSDLAVAFSNTTAGNTTVLATTHPDNESGSTQAVIPAGDLSGNVTITARLRNTSTDTTNATDRVNLTASQSTAGGFIDIDPSNLSGSGTQADPYEISNASELQSIEDDLDAHYVLVSDIDATMTSEWNDGQGFDPLGHNPFNESTNPPFHGTFDGNHHTIVGLTVHRPSQTYVGLFGNANGTITNVTLIDVSITGGPTVGGLSGSVDGTTIENVSITGVVDGTASHTGGLVGHQDASVIANVSTSVAVTGDNGVGGITGYKLDGTVEYAIATGPVHGGDNAGGLVGRNNGGTITRSVAIGDVSGTEWVGGLVGFNIYEDGTIQNAYATGTVTGATYVGGLIGKHQGTLEHGYATGHVTGTSSVGGLTGSVEISDFLGGGNGTIIESYWDTTTTNQSSSAGTATGLTTTEMTGEAATSNMSGFPFGTVWTTEPDAYPRLTWQSTTTSLPGPESPAILAPEDMTYDPSVDLTFSTYHNATGDIAPGDVAVRIENVTGTNQTTVATNTSLPVEGDAWNTISHGDLHGNVTLQAVLYNATSGTQHASTILNLTTTTNDDTTQATTSFTPTIDSPSSPITEGDQLDVTATITNDGDASGTQTVALTIDGQTRDTTEVTLAAGASKTVTLAWLTNEGDAGSYQATVSTANDTTTASIDVATADSGTPTFDVAIDATNAPITEGDTLNVTATITNTGDGAGTQTISLVVNGTEVATSEVSLAAGESQTITLSWTTTDGDAGDYTATVSSPDTQAQQSVTINSAEAALEVVDATLGSNTTTADDGVNVTAQVANTGTDPGTTTATLYLNDTPIAQQSVTVDPGNTTTIRFGDVGAGRDPGTYDIRINNQPAGTLTINESTDESTPIDTPGFGLLPPLLALVLISLRRRHQR